MPPDDTPPIVIAPATVIAPGVTADRTSQPLSPTTTAEEDRKALITEGETARVSLATEEALALKAQGQRQINLIWETTQMRVALSVIWSALIVSVALAIFGQWLGSPDIQLAAVVFLFGVANLVTGFYFGRTNHQKTGGVGGDVAGTR